MAAALPRVCTQNQWNAALDAAGKLGDWVALPLNTTLRAKDRAYLISGGDSGRYAEDSSKLKRLCAAIGVDLAAIMTAALA